MEISWGFGEGGGSLRHWRFNGILGGREMEAVGTLFQGLFGPISGLVSCYFRACSLLFQDFACCGALFGVISGPCLLLFQGLV